MVVDRYKGHLVYRMRENNYKVLEGKEVFHIYDENTGKLAFAFIGFYNPKRVLRPDDKETMVAALMQPALAAIRQKIDSGDLTDGKLHVESAARISAPSR